MNWSEYLKAKYGSDKFKDILEHEKKARKHEGK